MQLPHPTPASVERLQAIGLEVASPGDRLTYRRFADTVIKLMENHPGTIDVQVDFSGLTGQAPMDPETADLLCLDLYFRMRALPRVGGLVLLEAFRLSLDGNHPKVLFGQARAGAYNLLSISDTAPVTDLFERRLISGEPLAPTTVPQMNLLSLVNRVRTLGGHLELYVTPPGGRQLEVYLPSTEQPQA